VPTVPSQSCIDFIKRFEGCRLNAYIDQGGRVTIGWGHTGGVQLGMQWGASQADEMLVSDLIEVINRVKAVVKVPISDNQLTALTSFTYNLGIGNLERSGLLRFLNLSQYDKAADQFSLWCHIGLYKSPGLIARREAERALFLTV
jgi:lysozyme